MRVNCKNTRRVFLFLIALPLGVIYCYQNGLADEKSVLINEVLINGPSGEEFIELYNTGEDAIILDNWYWCYFSSTKTAWDDCYRKKKFETAPLPITIPSHTFYLIGFKGYPIGSERTSSDWQPYDSAFLGNSAGTVALFYGEPSEKTLVDAVGWGGVSLKENNAVDGALKGKGIARKNFQDTDDNLVDFSITEDPSPQNKTYRDSDLIIVEDTDLPSSTTTVAGTLPLPKVFLNELLPNPKGDDTDAEYIELYNAGESAVDLAGWIIKDTSKNGAYAIPEHTIIGAREYIVFFRSAFGFALTNSGAESVSLTAPDHALVDTISYSETAAEGKSYNRIASDLWRWSKIQTLGAENIIPQAPSITRVTIPKKIYANVAADFSLALPDHVDEKDVSVRWDFGDGRKSYKAITRHTYMQSGIFSGSVRLTVDGEATTESFAVAVAEYPRRKVRITGLLPNPEGVDADNEWIEVENRSAKEISLLGWSVATGQTRKKIVNHPIKTDVKVKPGKRLRITTDDASFSLGNIKTRVELRYPDGVVAHAIAYESDGVAENASYIKQKGARWKWQTKDEKDATEDALSSAARDEAELGQTSEDVDYGAMENARNEEDGIVLGDFSERPVSRPSLCTTKINLGATRSLQHAAIGLSFLPSVSLSATHAPSFKTKVSPFLRINMILNTLLLPR